MRRKEVKLVEDEEDWLRKFAALFDLKIIYLLALYTHLCTLLHNICIYIYCYMIYIYERDWLRKFAALFNLVIEEVEGVLPEFFYFYLKKFRFFIFF